MFPQEFEIIRDAVEVLPFYLSVEGFNHRRISSNYAAFIALSLHQRFECFVAFILRFVSGLDQDTSQLTFPVLSVLLAELG